MKDHVLAVFKPQGCNSGVIQVAVGTCGQEKYDPETDQAESRPGVRAF